ncbi:hypothetical protein [Occultella gossypii]|uniref:Uncharacterized protein n=1 Tax=Occultella gossypii TaxID=2800820 RepID=A0ABS7SBB9_9MICO|nr:hypothetical protein [Occultella gossypii]MBZ2197173.1 hypothetical protein [Occultella gossypii]
MKRLTAVLASVSLAAAGLAVTATAASAGLTTRCIGDAGAVTVPGDLVVPADKTCVLTGTTIDGAVRLQPGANLIITDGTITGAVVLNADSYFDAVGTSVGGNINNRDGYGVYLEDATVAGAYVGQAGESVNPFFYAVGADVNRRVEAVQGALYLESTQVGGPVTAIGTEYADVVDSTLLRDLTVSGNVAGATLCGSEVDGNVTYTENGGVQVGTGSSIAVCEDVTYIGGSLTASNNTVGVAVNEAIIRGDLGGEGNDPAPTGADNRVRGEISGQFVDLAPASQPQARTFGAEVSNEQLLLDSITERRTAAETEAAADGPANL